MTKEEMEKFVTETITMASGRRIWPLSAVERTMVRHIVDRWKDDVDEAFQRGVHAGQESR